MTKTTNTLRAVYLLDQVALDLETVSREPDSPVDQAIKILRHLSRHAEPLARDETHGAVLIKSYQDALKEAVAKLESVLNTESPSGTLTDAIKDIEAVIEYLTGCIGWRTSPSQREPIPSIQTPPSLKGEPADALDKPARSGFVPYNSPAPTDEEKVKVVRIQKTADAILNLLHPMVAKQDASKGESIVQACAQIRGELCDTVNTDAEKRILFAVDQIEAQAFAKDTPTFALNSNGNPLDDEQVELIRCIKEARRELISLANRTQQYLMAKQKRLKATCDANPCNDIDHEFTEAQAAAYAAYAAFGEAQGYGWVDRGVSDVQVGVMALVRAVAGPTE